MQRSTNLSVGAEAEPDNPCRNSTVPSLVGKTVKEVTRTTVKIPGRSEYTAITIVFTDGTKAMGAGYAPAKRPPITTDGALVVVSDKGCPFVVY